MTYQLHLKKRKRLPDRMASLRIRRSCLLIVAASLAVQAGCVTLAPPAPSARASDDWGVIAIVPARYTPASNFVTFAKGRSQGAAKGAAIVGGTMAGATAIAAAAAAGTVAYPVVILAAVLSTATAAGVGAVEGARIAVPPPTAQEVERVIGQAVAGLDVQRKVAGQLSTLLGAERHLRLASADAAGPTESGVPVDYAPLGAAGIDTVLEVAITDIGFESCGSELVRRLSSACEEPPNRRMIDLYMAAQARLVRVADGAEIYARRLNYKSARREIPRWVESDGRLLAEEIEHAYRELAERVRDEVVLLARIDLPMPSRFGVPGEHNPMYGICWLAPVYPKAQPLLVSEVVGSVFQRSDACPASGLHFSAVDSLQPTLAWSPFPRAVDRQRLEPATLEKIRDVTYDLRIWREEGCERGRPVYERSGLSAPVHRLEQPLAPESRYFWSVRARFVVEDRAMVTRWSHFDPLTCFPNDIADWQYHRFATPK